MKLRSTFLLALALVGVSGSAAMAQHSGIRTPDWSRPQRYEHNPHVQFNPWGGVTISTGRDKIYDSAYDPNRDYVDPGSVRVIDEIYYDAWGRRVRRSGREWTSFGVPHADVTTTVVSNLGGGSQSVDTTVTVRDKTTQRYGASGRGGAGISRGSRGASNFNRQRAVSPSYRPSTPRRGYGG